MNHKIHKNLPFLVGYLGLAGILLGGGFFLAHQHSALTGSPPAVPTRPSQVHRHVGHGVVPASHQTSSSVAKPAPSAKAALALQNVAPSAVSPSSTQMQPNGSAIPSQGPGSSGMPLHSRADSHSIHRASQRPLYVTSRDEQVTAAESRSLESDPGVPFSPAGTDFTVYTVHLSVAALSFITKKDYHLSVRYNSPGKLIFMPYNSKRTNPFNASPESIIHPYSTGANFSLPVNTRVVRFAVFNGKMPSFEPVTISIYENAYYGHTVTTTYRPSLSPTTEMVPVQSSQSTQINLSPGDTGHVAFQLEDGYGDIIAKAGIPVSLYLQPEEGLTLPSVVTLDGHHATESHPIHLMTNNEGQVSATLANPSDVGGAYYVEANSGPGYSVIDVPTGHEVQALGLLMHQPGSHQYLPPINIPPVIKLPLNTSLDDSEFGGSIGYGLYVEGINTSSGQPIATSGSRVRSDEIRVFVENPTIVGTGSIGEATLGSFGASLPGVVANHLGVTHVTIVDVSNPDHPQIDLTIQVVPRN